MITIRRSLNGLMSDAKIHELPRRLGRTDFNRKASKLVPSAELDAVFAWYRDQLDHGRGWRYHDRGDKWQRD